MRCTLKLARSCSSLYQKPLNIVLIDLQISASICSTLATSQDRSSLYLILFHIGTQSYDGELQLGEPHPAGHPGTSHSIVLDGLVSMLN